MPASGIGHDVTPLSGWVVIGSCRSRGGRAATAHYGGQHAGQRDHPQDSRSRATYAQAQKQGPRANPRAGPCVIPCLS